MIRPMTAADLDAVLVLEALGFSDPWPREAFQEGLDDPAQHYLVVEQGGAVVGCMGTIRLADHRVHALTITIHPDWRRRGLGRRLLAAALQQARDWGARSFTLEVRVGNTAARNFYRTFDAVTLKRLRRYYRDGEDALLLSLPL
ncbi:MAG: ribosomal protein S18-alanine N-acetyltransferase [Anaerolineae bacterium]